MKTTCFRRGGEGVQRATAKPSGKSIDKAQLHPKGRRRSPEGDRKALWNFLLIPFQRNNFLKKSNVTFPFQLCFINIKNREVSRRHRGKGKAGLPQRVFKLLYPPVRIERTMGIIHHLFPFVKAFSEIFFLKYLRIVRVFKEKPGWLFKMHPICLGFLLLFAGATSKGLKRGEAPRPLDPFGVRLTS